ncbi:TetR/AcrR family transcriptional regulator [Streptomyces sparsogenes]|uniref:TetR family transcriptional regulator n=1 Tax=Streptomyces sparsogenes DSM 40356 TaxID=1331668 RepID=A0A1R1SNG5_9ACTN|nr:TetR/AcrR family transcriptional regulator [Streptomyces sparsogenes]OMI39865.1 TetR family transcriptional regulator [Streptomyces sparsogenes DSM 40356]
MGEAVAEIAWTPKARTILEAASRLFYAHGIAAVGVDLIAEEAGVTKKTLYDRFGSKERLVVEYLRHRDERWREFLDHRLAETPDTPEARLAAVFDASGSWMRDAGGKGCGMVNAHAEISDPAHPAHRVIVDQKAWMLGLFRRLCRDAGLTAPEETARTLMLLHEGALVAHGIGAFPGAVHHARDAALAVFARAR